MTCVRSYNISMAGFSFRKQLDGTNEYTLMEMIGANSVVFQRGDLIRVNNAGFAALVTTGDLVLGVVEAVVDKNGIAVAPDSGTTDTWTMNSANQTSASYQYKVQYIPALPQYLFYNDSDDTLARTNLFQYFPVNDENDVNGSSSSDTVLDTVRLIEIDPDHDGDASKGLFQIVESFWAQNAMGTVDTGGIEA